MGRKYLNVATLPPAGMLLAVAGGKHVTVFTRKPTAPGAGSPAIKARFAGCAEKTKGIRSRHERNAAVASCMGGRKVAK